MARDNQFSFAGGEIAPNLHGRVDIAKYDVSVALAENFYVFPQGGVANRPGTRFVMELPETARLMPFKFSIVQTYALVHRDQKMHVVKDGGPVLLTGTNITGATAASPVVITANGHNIANGELLYIESVGGMTEINNRYFKAANITANTLELNHVYGGNVDGSAFTAYTSGGTVEEVYQLTTPYIVDDISTLKYTQSFDTMTLVHPSYSVRDLTRTGHASWTLTEVTFAPEVETPANAVLSGAGSTGGAVSYSYKVTAVVDETGEESLPSDAAETATGDATLSATNVITVGWDAVAGADRYNVYKSENGVYGFIGTAEGLTFDDTNIDADTTNTPPRARNPFEPEDAVTITGITAADPAVVTAADHGYSTGDIVLIEGVVGMTEVNDTHFQITVLSSSTFSLQTLAGDDVDSSAYTAYSSDGTASRAHNYPGVATYFQQRKVFANTNNDPQTVWMTQVGHYKNMSVSSPAKDDDAITFTIAANQVNAIKAMVPLNDLLILTEDGSVIAAGSGEPLTPSSVQIKPQQNEGASDVPPIVSGNSVVFVQERGRKVRDIGYTFESDTYTGNDLTLLAGHLLEDREIVEWAYQKVPNNLIWCVLSDGEGLVLTYVKEQQVFAWTRIVTDGLLKSVTCIPEGDEDAVYFVVQRTIGGTARYFLERLERRIDDDVKDAFFVDCGLSLDNPVTITGATAANPVVITAEAHGFSNGDEVDIAAILGMTELNDRRFTVANKTNDTFELSGEDGSAYTAYVSGGEVRKAVLTVSGLEHLIGETVVALADGNVESGLTVSASGSITLSSKASRIHVGLPYVSDIQTLPVDTTDGGATAKKKNIVKAIARVLRSRGFKAGPDEDTLYEAKQREFEDMGDPIALKTGFFELPISSQWGYEGQTYIRQSYPLPLTILGLSLEVTVGG